MLFPVDSVSVPYSLIHPGQKSWLLLPQNTRMELRKGLRQVDLLLYFTESEMSSICFRTKQGDGEWGVISLYFTTVLKK